VAKAALPQDRSEQETFLQHGAASLPGINVDSYSLELEDDDGFAGDKASKGAFFEVLEKVREPLRKLGEDPLGDDPSDQISRKKLAALLEKGEPQAAAVVQSAVEHFAQQLQSVIRRFLKLKSWCDTECIVVGGGFRASRIGELAIARAGIVLKTAGVNIELRLIEHDPDAAALIGATHLLPAWMVGGYEAMLAADIGGTNIRAGIIELNLGKAKDLSKARVVNIKHWCHKDEKGIKRDEAVDQLAQMLAGLIGAEKKNGLRLAPVIGVGCPGLIQADGSIKRGAQNLPGNWESNTFNLPRAICERIPKIGDHETIVTMHNDAVVQGLSEIPHMRSWKRWGILTIGTGLGNARFSNRAEVKGKRSD
jgi:predicted NBD/HSP70 family sugar kinase